MKTKLPLLIIAIVAGFAATQASANPWRGVPAGFKSLHESGRSGSSHCTSCNAGTSQAGATFGYSNRWSVPHASAKRH